MSSNNHSFQSTNTYKNIMTTITGESVASTKYRIYGEKAKEEGFEQIGNIFNETAGNEGAHAEVWYKILNGGEIPTTLENLRDAYTGEYKEWTKLYPSFAEEARREGYPEIACLFEEIAGVERHHDARYRELSHNIMNDKVFCKDTEVVWICLNCGNLYYGECAPCTCPLCGYPQGFYQLNCDNI